jgi:hypothetical protein
MFISLSEDIESLGKSTGRHGLNSIYSPIKDKYELITLSVLVLKTIWIDFRK